MYETLRLHYTDHPYCVPGTTLSTDDTRVIKKQVSDPIFLELISKEEVALDQRKINIKLQPSKVLWKKIQVKYESYKQDMWSKLEDHGKLLQEVNIGVVVKSKGGENRLPAKEQTVQTPCVWREDGCVLSTWELLRRVPALQRAGWSSRCAWPHRPWDIKHGPYGPHG